MKKFIISNLCICVILSVFSSCKKDENARPGDITIKFLEPYSDTEVLPDTVYVASDLSINYRALISPIENVEVIHFRIFFDYTQALEYNYAPSHSTGGTAYLIDSIRYPIDYKMMAGSIHFVTMQVEAVTFDGAKKESHLTYEIQPVNYPFQFRFFDFNSSDTLQAGQTVTMRPYFSPMTVNQTITSMKCSRRWVSVLRMKQQPSALQISFITRWDGCAKWSTWFRICPPDLRLFTDSNYTIHSGQNTSSSMPFLFNRWSIYKLNNKQ